MHWATWRLSVENWRSSHASSRHRPNRIRIRKKDDQDQKDKDNSKDSPKSKEGKPEVRRRPAKEFFE